MSGQSSHILVRSGIVLAVLCVLACVGVVLFRNKVPDRANPPSVAADNGARQVDKHKALDNSQRAEDPAPPATKVPDRKPDPAASFLLEPGLDGIQRRALADRWMPATTHEQG